MTIEPDYFHFRIGKFKCTALSDGGMNYPTQSLISNVESSNLALALTASNENSGGTLPAQLRTPYMCLFVDTGKRKVMIDVGSGSMGAQAKQFMPEIDHLDSITGLLLKSMRRARIKPANIDAVILTHAHPDHVAGMLDGQQQPIFSRAEYFMCDTEWSYWMSSDSESAQRPAADMIRTNLQAIRNRINFVTADEQQIIPGIKAVMTPGHSPGHMGVLIESRGQNLLHIGDGAMHTLQLQHPAWESAYDVDPAAAVAARQKLRELIATYDPLIIGHHLAPFPGLGLLHDDGQGLRWFPLLR